MQKEIYYKMQRNLQISTIIIFDTISIRMINILLTTHSNTLIYIIYGFLLISLCTSSGNKL